jgi:phosphoenolpyruvate phosphomutase
MLKAKDEGITYLKNAIEQLKSDKNFNQMSVPDLLNYMVEQGKNIKVLYIHGHWLDVNVLEDIDRATDFTHGL